LKRFFYKWIEKYLFDPNPLQRVIGVCFFPLTVLYCIYTTSKRISQKPVYFGIPVISIGNLVVGGSGKTPITIELAKSYKNPAVVLRGYGRESKGLYVVSKKGKILEDIKISGDEAMMLSLALPQATVIVSEDRVKGIQKAKELGCEVVFLDDGYNKHNIAKYDILIRPKVEPKNIFCLPSGGYRDTPMMYSFVDLVLKDGVDFIREVKYKYNNRFIETLPSNLVLITAISKPDRLLEYLPQDVVVESFEDHYNFKKIDIESILNKYPQYSFITTQKDFVKLDKFNIPNLYLMDLTIDLKTDCKIDDYINFCTNFS